MKLATIAMLAFAGAAFISTVAHAQTDAQIRFDTGTASFCRSVP